MLNKKNQNIDKHERAIWSDLVSLGVTFPTIIILGILIGKKIGNMLNHTNLGIITGLIWGIMSAFLELYRITKKLKRMNTNKNHKS